MEVAVIDWKTLDSRFVKDDLYEHINAPKWVDFSAPDDPVDDVAWFCRPSCDHPKTAEDSFDQKQRTPASNSKLQRSSSSVSDIPPFSDRTNRDAILKKRVPNQPLGLSNRDSKHYTVIEDGENQDPNFSTPLNQKARVGKEAIKSSTETKKRVDEVAMKNEQAPKLRSTMSARNLFSGGDLLNKVAEFCNELKKLATRTNKDNSDWVKECLDENLGVGNNEKEKERKPLLGLSNKAKSEVMDMSGGGSKGQQRIRKKKINDAENTPISIDVKKREPLSSSQIRTCPPTPQCFSAGNGPSNATTTPKPFRQRPMDRGILQELKQTNKKEVREEKIHNNGGGGGGEVNAEKEARSLDVFWFLKPCTL